MVEMPAKKSNLSRRGFLGVTAGAVASVPLFAACSSSSGGSKTSATSASAGGSTSAATKTSTKTLKFWDMPWGGTTYNPAAKKFTESYVPAAGNGKVSYQEIQWANFTQTFASAIASNTGPAVSTGGGFQAFEYAQQGKIAYADNVIAKFKKDGTYADFLTPALVEAMKTAKGYAAVPWQLDIRVWWYNKAVFSQLGLTPPTTWAEVLTVGKALKAKGYYGFASGAGAGQNIGAHQMVMMMINNGGGLFSKDGKVDLVTPRNIEAMEFIKELQSNKIIDPRAVSYTIDNLNQQWKSKKCVMGIDTAGLDSNIGDTSGDLVVMPAPIAGPHGDKACLVFENNIMMYTNTPSQASSEAFLEWYIKNMKTYWEQNLLSGLPVLKSIAALPAFKKQTNKITSINAWVPVAKTYAAQGTTLSPLLAKVDGGNPLQVFTQSLLSGTDATKALKSLQSTLDALNK
jgi:multiple sugar transport system substrate-binding protein